MDAKTAYEVLKPLNLSEKEKKELCRLLMGEKPRKRPAKKPAIDIDLVDAHFRNVLEKNPLFKRMAESKP
jgi:hypothetical protein